MSDFMKVSQTYRVTQKKIDEFAAVSGGVSKIHTDPIYAEKTLFRGTLVHGLYLVALIEKELDLLNPYWKGWLETTFVKPIRTEQPFKILLETGDERNTIKISVILEDNDLAVVGCANLK